MKLIIDGNNLINAAYFVISDESKPVDAIVGLFSTMMKKLKRDFNTEELYIAWDGHTGTKWRKEILPEYKSTRTKEGKDNLYLALTEVLKTDFKHFWVTDMEADDVIYCLSSLLDGVKVIVSGDHDFIQIVQEGKARGVFRSVQKDYMKIPTWDSVLEKSVCGDSSDALKGLKGVGPKGFQKLLENNFSTLTDEQREIFEKHKLIIGLKNNPLLQRNLEIIKNMLTIN